VYVGQVKFNCVTSDENPAARKCNADKPYIVRAASCEAKTCSAGAHPRSVVSSDHIED
jgi:hypothetical protein